MKSLKPIVVVLLILSVVFVSFPQIEVQTEPKTIFVPDNYATIQEAVNGAGEGDVVYVRSGSYNENVYINKSLSLIGEDMSKTSIIGDWEMNGTVVSVSHDGVAIRDFTVKTSSSSWVSGVGIHLLNARYCNVSNCNFVIIGSGIQLPINGCGIWLYGSSEITVKDIQIDCTNIHNSYGIRLQDSSCNSIVGNTITRCNYGSVLENSNGNNLTENHILDNFRGINVLSSSNNSVILNNISNNFRGLDFTASENNSVSGNHIANNNDGIAIENMYNNLIENTITNNTNFGIYLYGGGYNNIIRNNITNNGRGISVSICYNNTFYNNNFVNNINHIETDDSNDNWDNGFEGNYWSNYNGIDHNRDGIGDTAYIIDANNIDRYPLMTPYEFIQQPYQMLWVYLGILGLGIFSLIVLGVMLTIRRGKTKK